MSNVWHRIGRDNPYWGVLTEDRYEAERMTPAALEEFFASGDRHLAEVLATIRVLRPAFAPRSALDFGCGVGRLVVPMSRQFERVIGVDISDGMLAEARKTVAARGGSARVELATSSSEEVDFAHSYIVLQHMPVAEGMAAMKGIVQRLKPGGVAMLHFPFWRYASWATKAVNRARHALPFLNPLINLYRGHPVGKPAMMGNCYDLNAVLRDVQAAGAGAVHCEFEERGAYRLVRLYVFKQAH